MPKSLCVCKPAPIQEDSFQNFLWLLLHTVICVHDLCKHTILLQAFIEGEPIRSLYTHRERFKVRNWPLTDGARKLRLGRVGWYTCRSGSGPKTEENRHFSLKTGKVQESSLTQPLYLCLQRVLWAPPLCTRQPPESTFAIQYHPGTPSWTHPKMMLL